MEQATPLQPNFQEIFESSPALFLILLSNDAFTIIAVSNAYLAGTMTQREKILGKNMFEVFPDNPEDPTADGVRMLRASLLRVLSTKMPDKMAIQKYDIRMPDTGAFEVRHWDPTNTPILDQEGNVLYIVHQVVDVTDLVNRTKERDTLEANVLQLRSELGLREQFVALLTHDLRNPLTAAKTSAQLLARQTGDPARQALLAGRIIDSLDRVNQMVENLLDANRIKAGQELQPNFSETDLQALVEKTLDELSSVHGTRFTLRSPSPVIGYWDSSLLRRILENLVNNAVKYGAPDTKITVAVTRVFQSVKLEVHNEGPVIAEDEKSSLFNQFHRGRNTGKGLKGWGLGLTLVKAFTEAHGGSIEVRSDAAHGTCFEITLPLDARASAGIRSERGFAQVLEGT